MPILPDAMLYIDGVLRPAEGGKTYKNIGPWTAAPVGKAADASAADVEEAIAAARRAFDTSEWSRDHDVRLSLVRRLRDLFVAQKERLALTIRHEAGAARGAAEKAQAVHALHGFDDLIEAFGKLPFTQDRGTRVDFGTITSHRKVVREATGVVAAITPWNFPLYVNVAKVVSALLAGCTVVLKGAPDTPNSASIFGELAAEVGFPAGVLNVITSSDPAMAGEMLVNDRRVDLVTFTGSTATGMRIMERGAKTLKRVFLELGGKSAKIILEDTPNFAQEVASSLLVFHAGQGCAILSRLLVPRSRYDEAVKILSGAYADFGENWGDFDNPDQVMGPVVSARQQERVARYIEIGLQEGARLLVGGKARPDKGAGFFIEPTCFVDVTSDMRIAQEEIFGPVLVVIPFDDDADAIRIANDTDYGLSGGVYSGDIDRAMYIADRLRTGTVTVNGGIFLAGDLPFGGYKFSGLGREWGVEGIEEYLETKTIALRA